jgi:HK97 family phage prohead protease
MRTNHHENAAARHDVYNRARTYERAAGVDTEHRADYRNAANGAEFRRYDTREMPALRPAVSTTGRDKSDVPVVVGYAARFDVPTLIPDGRGGRFREIIRRGAFDSAATDDCRALFNHDENFILGRTTAGTLKITQDAFGLRYVITPPDTAFARHAVTAIQRGDVTGSSFGFRTVKDSWGVDTADGMRLREVLAVRTFDISPCVFPAYEATSAGAVDNGDARDCGHDDDDDDLDTRDAVPWKDMTDTDLHRLRMRMAQQGCRNVPTLAELRSPVGRMLVQQRLAEAKG